MHAILASINCIGKGVIDVHPLSVVITSNNSQAYTGNSNFAVAKLLIYS